MTDMRFNPAFEKMPAYAFPRLRALLADIPPGKADTLDLTLGAPRHPPPGFVKDIISDNFESFSKYPPISGTPALKEAIQSWLAQRYGVNIAPSAILPLVGTREGLYMLSHIAVHGARRHVLMPNPLYPCYNAAALAMGAQPVHLSGTRETGFLPDLDAVPEDIWQTTALFYLCSPSNPEGAAADAAYLRRAIGLARQHGFLLAMDECYAEIWTHSAPVGALEVASELPAVSEDPFANVVVFHSLSKRSNLPGLRSGFIAGDQRAITAFEKLRSYGGPTMPLPLQAASAACWADQEHVEENRALYAEKYHMVEQMLGVSRPAGGFFLWLPVEDGEKTALHLWKSEGIRVLPGGYLATESENGQNPAQSYIRVALVDMPDATREALSRLKRAL